MKEIIFSGKYFYFINNSIFNSKKKDNYNQIFKSIIQDCYSYYYINPKELEIELIDAFEKNAILKERWKNGKKIWINKYNFKYFNK